MDTFIACHECDLIHSIKKLPAKGAANCTRCGAVLYKHIPNSWDRTLAFALAALILFILANKTRGGTVGVAVAGGVAVIVGVSDGVGGKVAVGGMGVLVSVGKLVGVWVSTRVV